MVSAEVLKRFGIFKGLDEPQLAKIGELCHERTRSKEAVCFYQGTKAKELHLCQSGRVSIFVVAGNVEIKIHTAKSGDTFGWSSLVEPYVYTASAKCLEEVKEIYLWRTDLLELFSKEPSIGYLVMTNLCSVISNRRNDVTDKLTRIIVAVAESQREN